MSRTLQAIKFDRESTSLEILDQLQLPYSTVYIRIASIDDAYDAIFKMQVRGAPAIAIVGAFAVAIDAKQHAGQWHLKQLLEKIEYLQQSRPTAVNLSNALGDIKMLLFKYDFNDDLTAEQAALILDYAVRLYDDDLANNYRIGDNGVDYISKSLQAENFKGPFSIMTICNTGSLATSGHGTALGIIRSVFQNLSSTSGDFYLEKVYPCETRPYNQGAKLTTYELDYEKIPFSLICDNMASSLISSLSTGKKVKSVSAPVKFIIVGADRIVRNGDTANKIGTFQLSVIANYFNSLPNAEPIKFIVAAPKTTIDTKTETGDEIEIEERPANELTTLKGPVLDGKTVGEKLVVGIATPNISVWNPAFDVTPHHLIDAIVTETEVFTKDANNEFKLQ